MVNPRPLILESIRACWMVDGKQLDLPEFLCKVDGLVDCESAIRRAAESGRVIGVLDGTGIRA